MCFFGLLCFAQFDVQSGQLTIRETVMFSAKMRIDRRGGELSNDHITKFVDKTLRMLELKGIEGLLVGTDVSGGLSFEQRKRLSIAVELASNPSIIFLVSGVSCWFISAHSSVY